MRPAPVALLLAGAWSDGTGPGPQRGNGVPVLSVGGFANYLDGVPVTNQSVFLTGWVSPVRVQGNVCGRGIDQTVAVQSGKRQERAG